MKNSGIKCEIGITYDNVERLNTYLEKAVKGADQLHIVAGVHDKQATTFSGYVYNKENTPIITNVYYPIEFDTDKVALIDLRVNKMYTDEFGHNFIKCRSLTEESLRKIVYAMQREVFGIVETEEPIEKIKATTKKKNPRKGYKPLSSNEDMRPLNDDIMQQCKSDKERKLFESIQPVKVIKTGHGGSVEYIWDEDSLWLIDNALLDGVTSRKRVAKRLNVGLTTFRSKLLEFEEKRAYDACNGLTY